MPTSRALLPDGGLLPTSHGKGENFSLSDRDMGAFQSTPLWQPALFRFTPAPCHGCPVPSSVSGTGSPWAPPSSGLSSAHPVLQEIPPSTRLGLAARELTQTEPLPL